MNGNKDTRFSAMHSLRMGGELLPLDRPLVVGILNITPDSFYDGGSYSDEASQVAQCRRMLDEGAAIIDIGAMSTRPGAEEISSEEEIHRLIPVIRLLCTEFPGIRISADTYRAGVAAEALKAGAVMINDISGGILDEEMIPFIAESHIPYVLMHMQGRPRTMQVNPSYEDVVTEVMRFFGRQLDALYSKGATDVVLDPGFGFGKTVEHNYSLLRALGDLVGLGQPLMVGISRKSMINKVLGTSPETALNGTTAAHMLALMQGAKLLRVHDVREAVQTIQVFEAFRGEL